MQQSCSIQSLPNSGVEEKLTRDETGHRSDPFSTLEKPSLEKSVKGSKLPGPCTSNSVTETTNTSSEILQGESNGMLKQ